MTADPHPPHPFESLRRMARHSTVIIAVVAALVAMKLAAAVLVPLILAGFLIIIAWPIKLWLDRHLPQSLSYAGSLIALSFVVITLLGVIWMSGVEITQGARVYQPAFESFVHEAKQELTQKGVDTHAKLTIDDLKNTFLVVAEHFKEGLIIICVMLSYVILAIPEAARWKYKLRRSFGAENSEKVLATTVELSKSFQSYIRATVLGGIINALLTSGTALLLGLDFPITWGVVIFLLNFVPTLGPSLMPVLMTALAFVQFNSVTLTPYLVFFSISAVQLFVVNFVEPRLQGNQLELSPVVVLFSLTFWAFLWGLPGALLATPLTYGLIIFSSHFPQTRWISFLLSETRPEWHRPAA